MDIEKKLLVWLERVHRLGRHERMYYFDVSEYQCVLPVNGSEDSELLKIGIDFGPFQKGDQWRGANLPPGWTIDKGESKSYICDDRNRARVIVYNKEVVIRPITRFSIGRDSSIDSPDKNVRFCVWDASVPHKEKRKVVFSSEHPLPSRKRHKDVHDSRLEHYQKYFEKKAREWLDERFPEWKSHSGHWDEEDDKETSKEEKDEPEETK